MLYVPRWSLFEERPFHLPDGEYNFLGCTAFISYAWQVTGSQSPLLTPTMQARCYNAGKRVRVTWRGITNLSKHVGALLRCMRIQD